MPTTSGMEVCISEIFITTRGHQTPGGEANLTRRERTRYAAVPMTTRSSMASIWDGKLDAAFAALNHTWTSLPGGRGQELSAEEAERYFWAQLGEAAP